jgi:hypothetical protein
VPSSTISRAHEERNVGGFRRFGQAYRFFYRIRDRLLDQHGNAVLYAVEAVIHVQRIRGSHDDTVRALGGKQIGEGGIDRGGGLSGELARTWSRVNDS